MSRSIRPLALLLAILTLSAPALPAAVQAADKVVPQGREQITLSFAPLVKEAAPAVVNIYTKKRVSRPGFSSQLFNDPLFQRFFGDGLSPFGMPRERVQNSLGSGVVVDPAGLVVTNFHVVAGAEEITVVTNDRREFPAEVILKDERTDLTVLRIDPAGQELTALEMGNSDNLEVGDLVLAIGNPFGVGQTVTSGIVSALARTNTGISDYSFFIQTDAAINPGNSGGALVTMDGRLVGINTAIFSKSGGSVGIGFAIPVNMVRTVVTTAEGGGEIVRPWTGFIGQNVTGDLAEGFGLDRASGVVINRIHPEGPAARAGLRKGDVVVALDGQPIDDLATLRYRLATHVIGREVEVEAVRGGETVVLRLPLEAAPEVPPRNQGEVVGRNPLAGAVVENLSPAVAEELELEGLWEGVVITGLRQGSPAHRLGFQPDDVILGVNDLRVDTVDDLTQSLQVQKAKWAITFRRGEKVRTVEIAG